MTEPCIKLPQMSHKVNFNSSTRWPLYRLIQFNVFHYSSKQDGDSILAYRCYGEPADATAMAASDRIGRMLLLSLFYSCLRGARGARGGKQAGGRGSTRPVASTGNGVVAFHDANRARACACDAPHSLTGMYGKNIYYLSLIHI